MSAGERVAVGVGGASAIGVPDPDDLLRVVRTALAEDLRYGPDATTAATVDRDAVAVAAFVLRAGGVLAGVPAVRTVFDEVLGSDGVVASPVPSSPPQLMWPLTPGDSSQRPPTS